MRWLGRFDMMRELWPGGPKVRDVIEAQLTPPPRPAAGTELAAELTVPVQLLLLLQ